LRETVIDFTTRTVLVSMVNLGTRTVWDVLTELAKIADFEIGLDGEGRFFFRNKSPSASSVVTLGGSNLEKVQSFSPGWDRVFNSIRASFGSYVQEANSTTEGEAAPTSIDRFGVRSLPVGGGSLVFQTDVDLATVMARRYFARYKEPKRRATVSARYMPELELGDRVAVDIQIPRQILQGFDARVLGVAHDLMNFKTELDLLEVTP
jgi:prophage tail gpP-like protein